MIIAHTINTGQEQHALIVCQIVLFAMLQILAQHVLLDLFFFFLEL